MVVLTKFHFEPLHSLPWFPVINPISLYTPWPLFLPYESWACLPENWQPQREVGQYVGLGPAAPLPPGQQGALTQGCLDDSNNRWQDRSLFQTEAESQITCKGSLFPWPPPLSPVHLMASASRTSSPGHSRVSPRGWLRHSEWDVSSLGRTADSHWDNPDAHCPHLPSSPSL